MIDVKPLLFRQTQPDKLDLPPPPQVIQKMQIFLFVPINWFVEDFQFEHTWKCQDKEGVLT